MGSDLETTPTRSYDVRTMPLSSTETITWRDAQRMPDDGNRYEAIGGELFMTPSPSVRHQILVVRLYDALRPLLPTAQGGMLLVAPLGVESEDSREGVQPDLLFVSGKRRDLLVGASVRGAPDLVVEVLSPSTAGRDRGIKRRLYERLGVPQYWIVDPVAEAIDVWRFGDDPECERFEGTLPVRLGAEEVGVIDLEAVFAPDL